MRRKIITASLLGAAALAPIIYFNSNFEKTLPVLETTVQPPTTEPVSSLEDLAKYKPTIGLEISELKSIEPELEQDLRRRLPRILGKKYGAIDEILEITPISRQTLVACAPDEKILHDYAREQEEILHRIKEYFGFTTPSKVVVARNKDDFAFSSSDSFVAYIVAHREEEYTLRVRFSQNGQEKSKEFQKKMSSPLGEVHSRSTLNREDSSQPYKPTLVRNRVIITPDESPDSRITTGLEYAHFVSKDRMLANASNALDNSRKIGVTEALINNEGAVHGCIMAGCETMGILSSTEVDKVLASIDKSPENTRFIYQSVRRWYDGTKEHGAKQLFDAYLQGK